MTMIIIALIYTIVFHITFLIVYIYHIIKKDTLSNYTYSSTKNPKDMCENCTSYAMIDSGYGTCCKNPPAPIVIGNKIYWKQPIVEFNRKNCREIKRGMYTNED